MGQDAIAQGAAGFSDFRRVMDEKKNLHSNGSEYWLARHIQEPLGYDTWEFFENAIRRAVDACRSAGHKPANHFREVKKKVEIGSGAQRGRADYYLSRLACYLIAMNGDTRKPEIGMAQMYFAVQTRRQEMSDEIAAKLARLDKRHTVTIHNKELFWDG